MAKEMRPREMRPKEMSVPKELGMSKEMKMSGPKWWRASLYAYADE